MDAQTVALVLCSIAVTLNIYTTWLNARTERRRRKREAAAELERVEWLKQKGLIK